MLTSPRMLLTSVLILIFAQTGVSQNLSDAQVAILSARLAESALKSWELGTRAQTILELNATSLSVHSVNPLPPKLNTSDPTWNQMTRSFFDIPRRVVSNRGTANKYTIGPQPLMPDGSAADPASIGTSVLLANWTGQDRGNTNLDYRGAAKDQLDYLLYRVPKTADGAISHRVSEVQLWNDFVYMVPPFLAYYGVLSGNQTLVMEAYNQIKLYRNHLRDSRTGMWKHVVLGSYGDYGYWTTGNGWAAAGMLRVLGTIRNSQYENSMRSQQNDLAQWVKEIHDGIFPHLDTSVYMWPNYANRRASDSGNFYDASGTALLASTVFRGAIMLNQYKHVPAAEKIRQTLFSPSSTSKSTRNTTFDNYKHFTTEGWLQPVVNPWSYGSQGSKSPEGQAFALQLHAAWRDWVIDGARGSNGAHSMKILGIGSGVDRSCDESVLGMLRCVGWFWMVGWSALGVLFVTCL